MRGCICARLAARAGGDRRRARAVPGSARGRAGVRAQSAVPGRRGGCGRARASGRADPARTGLSAPSHAARPVSSRRWRGGLPGDRGASRPARGCGGRSAGGRPGRLMDLYGRLFRGLLHPAWESGIRRRPTLRHLRELKRSQWWSEDELHALQCRELERLVRHAYRHVPLYRARFEAAGLAEGDVRTPADLARLPILTRDEARDQARERESVVPPLPSLRKQTSGTTGQPLLFGYEPASEHFRQAVKLRAYEWAGYRPGDKALFFWGAPLPHAPPLTTRAKIALDRRLKRERHVPCAVMTVERLREVVRAIERERPQVLVC